MIQYQRPTPSSSDTRTFVMTYDMVTLGSPMDSRNIHDNLVIPQGIISTPGKFKAYQSAFQRISCVPRRRRHKPQMAPRTARLLDGDSRPQTILRHCGNACQFVKMTSDTRSGVVPSHYDRRVFLFFYPSSLSRISYFRPSASVQVLMFHR